VEALGRIFFESLDYGIPFIGFKAGGIGEIATILHLRECMIDDSVNWKADLYSKILNIEQSLPKYQAAKESYEHYFSAPAYCKAVEEVIIAE
jgi:hypothetical protein